jgi:hypothetical protein
MSARHRKPKLPENRDDGRVPVMCGEYCIERADPARIRHLLKAGNVTPVKLHHGEKIIRLNVRVMTDDTRLPERRGNPQKDITRAETDYNVVNVWSFKRRAA